MTGAGIQRVLMLGVTGLALSAPAQEPAYMDAATHPGRGQFYGRMLFQHGEGRTAGDAGEEFDESGVRLSLSHGITARLAAVAEGIWADRDYAGDRAEQGLAEGLLRLKWRVAKVDLGPLDTWRTSLYGGVRLAGDLGDAEDFSARTSPTFTVASTLIVGRHGVNGALGWTAPREEADGLAVNASYLFRLAPALYAADTPGAWYVMVESLNEWDTDGGRRLELAPGLLYEARGWAWEIAVRLPVSEHRREERDWEVTAGYRHLF